MYHFYITLLIEHENVTVKSRGQFLSQNLKHFWFPDLILSVSGMALGLTRLWSSWKVLHQEQSWRQSHSSPVRMPQFVLSIQITTFSSYKTKPNLQVKAKKIVCITSKLALFSIFFFRLKGYLNLQLKWREVIQHWFYFMTCFFVGYPKKNKLKKNSYDVLQTVFIAFTCKFGLVL